MDIWQIIMTPFSWLLKMFCQWFDSYGVALILFTIVIKIILFPFSLKGKKSMIKMNAVNAQLQEIQKRCGNDRERYNQEVQKFYQENNVSPTGGCLWSFIPLFILLPLYQIIRRPFKYMMRMTEEGTSAIAKALGFTAKFGTEFAAGNGYSELNLASMLNSEATLTTASNAAIAAGASATGLFIINFNFLGLDLSQVPALKFWEAGISWNSIGLFLMPLISAALSVLSMIVSQRTSKMKKNEQENQQTKSTNRTMMIVQPLISLWIGYSMPAGLCVYWIANSLLMMVQEWLCGRILRKDYEEAQRIMEEQALKNKEAEKKRRREAAERKAAAIAEGKKKAQPQSKSKASDVAASREGMRSYARGRAYDPDRYPTTPYHDPNDKNPKPEDQGPLTEEEKQILNEAGVEIPEETPVVEAAPAVEEAPADQEGFEEAYAPESEDEEPNA